MHGKTSSMIAVLCALAQNDLNIDEMWNNESVIISYNTPWILWSTGIASDC